MKCGKRTTVCQGWRDVPGSHLALSLVPLPYTLQLMSANKIHSAHPRQFAQKKKSERNCAGPSRCAL